MRPVTRHRALIPRLAVYVLRCAVSPVNMAATHTRMAVRDRDGAFHRNGGPQLRARLKGDALCQGRTALVQKTHCRQVHVDLSSFPRDSKMDFRSGVARCLGLAIQACRSELATNACSTTLCWDGGDRFCLYRWRQHTQSQDHNREHHEAQECEGKHFHTDTVFRWLFWQSGSISVVENQQKFRQCHVVSNGALDSFKPRHSDPPSRIYREAWRLADAAL